MRRLQKPWIPVLGVLLVLTAARAGANTDPMTAADPNQVRTYGTGQRGDQRAEIVRSAGRAVPLYKAIIAIIPRGYAFRTIGVDQTWLDQPVSWSGGREWPEVLREALSTYPELTLEISLGSKLVLLRQQHPQTDDSMPRELNGYAAARAKAEQAAAPDRWEVKPADKSLRMTLNRWAATAGWQLSWELNVDYPVTAGASLGGTFEEAVATIVMSMAQAETPLKAIFYRANRVIRIVAKGNE